LQEKAHTGFEPVFGESADEPIDPALISPVRAKLDELLAKYPQPDRDRERCD
jgi:hypothetical protein